jgi:Tol biopolymer transport system component
VIRKCLAKDPDARWQSADDLADELRWIAAELSQGQPPPPAPARLRRATARLVMVAVALMVVLATGAAIWKWRDAGPTGTPTAKQITANPVERRLTSAALSPDGNYAAYSDPLGVHVRAIDSVDAQLLPQTEGMIVQRWSGDGTRVITNRALNDSAEQWSISLLGTREREQIGNLSPDSTALANVDNNRVILTDVRTGTNRTLVDYGTGIPGVDFGGPETRVTAFEWSPSGRWLLVAVVSGPAVSSITGAAAPNQAGIERVDPKTGARVAVLKEARFGPITALTVSRSGRIVYCHAGRNIWSFQLDDSTGTRLDEPRKITDWRDVTVQSVSASGDGKRVLYLRTEQQSDVHVGRLAGDGTTVESPERMTMDERFDIPYAWAPDSRSLYFWSNRSGNTDVYRQAIGDEKAELIVGGAGHQCCPRVTPDGKWILFRNHSSDQQGERFPTLRRVPVDGGLHEEVVGKTGLNYHRCGFRSRCIVSFISQKSVTLFDLDWMTGKLTELMTMPADAKGDPDVSPDGRLLAVLVGPPKMPARAVRIIDVASKASSDIEVKGAQYLMSLDWAPDGRGLWSVDGGGFEDTRVWYVPLKGDPFVLAGTKGLLPRWVIPSPDGAKLAIFSNTIKRNAWTLDGF